VLTKLDDLAFHQLPTTFDHAVSSDPRWFEHMVFFMVAKEGDLAIFTGNRTYLNTNVIESFAVVVHRGKQYNVRASRALRPEMDRAVGPLKLTVVEGLRSFELTLGKSEIPVEFSMVWQASGVPWEEPHHFRRHQGRVVDDHMRFNQVGTCAGHVVVERKRIELTHEQSFAARDHSWGIRAGIGGDSFGGAQFQFGAAHWMLLDIEGIGQGYFSCVEDRQGKPTRCQGTLGARYGVQQASRPITGYRHTLNFHPGTRLVRGGRVTVMTGDGESFQADVEAISRPVNEHGAGYQNGFADGRGIGVNRGALLVEGDIWDHTDLSVVVNLGPTQTTPNNRLFDHVVRLSVGNKIGYAIYVLFAPGLYEPYGFPA
jgi:hypothetical protein